MRKLCLLAALISPLACAQVVSVETNSLMRLPNTASTLQLERLEVADYGTLLIPSNVTEVTVGELHLGREARIAIVPGEQALALKVRRADCPKAARSPPVAAPGTYQKAARSGRNLELQIKALNAAAIDRLMLAVVRAHRGSLVLMGPTARNRAAPGVRRVAVPMAVMAAMVSREHRGRWSSWQCRAIPGRPDQGSGGRRCRWPGRPWRQTGGGWQGQGLPGLQGRWRQER